MSNEQSFVQARPQSTLSDSTGQLVMTRRQMLRRLATTSAVLGGLSLAGGGILTACGGSGGSTGPVTLLLGSWPINPLPSTIQKDEYTKTDTTSVSDVAQVSAIQDWLKQNPHVTLKHTAVVDNATNSQQVIAAIAARTAPAIYATFGDPNKDDTSINNYAVELGYAADPTDVLQQFNPNNSQLADYAVPLWEATRNGEGHYYGLPGDLASVGSGVFYRRDIAQQKGLIPPTPDWTWEEFHTFAQAIAEPGQTAMGAPSYMVGYMLNSNLLDPLSNGGLLGSVPVPSGNWHEKINLTPWFNEWTDRVNLYRSMIAEKLIDQDANLYSWEGQASAKMADGTYNMTPAFFSLLTFGGYAPVTINQMSTRYNKPLDELVSYITYPYGSNGAFNSNVISPNMGAALLNPHLNTYAKSMATSLYFYMFFGQGYIDFRYRRYEKTKRPQDLFDYIAPTNKYQLNPKVPNVTVQDVYGKLADDYMALLKTPIVPKIGQYLKPEQTASPVDDGHQDLLNKLSLGQGDIVAALQEYQQTRNQQFSAVTATLSTSDFTAGAKKFYQDTAKFWQKNSPEFYNGDWNTFYTNEIVPVLGS